MISEDVVTYMLEIRPELFDSVINETQDLLT